MLPDAALHNPSPDYIRALLERAGLSQRAAAKRLGISERMMRYYVATDSSDHRSAPYCVQFALETLANAEVESQAPVAPAPSPPLR
ncbi:MAG: hypothetical protein BGO72_21365 [Burkholderiales bacterium 70-64]|nr:MAG: hypothetical protein BGO72_21365 [Burkholderiales bacterium 70-64]